MVEGGRGVGERVGEDGRRWEKMVGGRRGWERIVVEGGSRGWERVGEGGGRWRERVGEARRWCVEG